METKKALTEFVSFRATEEMAAAVRFHKSIRRLEKFSDAARELLALGIAAEEVAGAAEELRRLGGDPEQALRHAIAAMEDPAVAGPIAATRKN